MIMLVPLAVALALVAGYAALALPNKEAQHAAVKAEAAALNFLSYRRAAIGFVSAHPSHSGPISDTQLGPFWPSGYIRNIAAWPWTSQVINGTLYVYASHANCGTVGSCWQMLDEVYQLSGRSSHVGIAVLLGSQLRLSNPGAGVTNVTLPSSVPVGAVVAYGTS